MDVVATPQKPATVPKKASPLEQRREREGWSNSELWRSQLDPAQVDGVGNFVCGFASVVTLQQQVEQRARHCKGCLTWELRRMTQHGLAGRCVARCSLHTDCEYLPGDGELVWESSPYDEGTKTYMVNELYCGAIGYSQALHEASATLLDCMMLKAPCDSDVYGFVHTKVAPVVQQMKEEEEERVAKQAMEDQGFVAGGFDTAHDAVRNVPNSVAAMANLASGELVTVNTLSDGTSASREPKLLSKQMDRCDELGIDLAVVAVDGCKDTAKQINAHQRKNAIAMALPFIRVAFESRKKTRGTKRAQCDAEDELLKRLAVLESEKDPSNPRECKSHPAFLSLSDLKPEFMSPRQVKAALDHFGSPLGEQPAETLRQMLSSDPIAECVAAVKEASKLAEVSRRRYFRHHSHSIRLVNETWGQASRSFKAWCITHSMLNFGKHMSNDHSNCRAHCWYSRCSDDDYIPREDFWTVCTGVGHPHGVPALAALLMKAWTLGKYMHSLFFATALHCRTSACESFFHAVDVWLPMWAGFSQKGYDLGVNCCFLTHNEQRRSKRLTTGRL